MKRFLSLLLCCIIALSLVACGKKDGEEKNSPDVKQTETVTKDNKGEAPAEENGGETETKVLPSKSAEELEKTVDEFNTTEDPERKEELRKELEEFLKQAEAMAPAN